MSPKKNWTEFMVIVQQKETINDYKRLLFLLLKVTILGYKMAKETPCLCGLFCIGPRQQCKSIVNIIIII